MTLRVVQPFDGMGVGDEIDDPKREAEIMASDHAAYVVRVAPPAPADDKGA